MDNTPWEPLAHGPRAWAALAAIADQLEARLHCAKGEADPTLDRGAAGWALFFAHLYQAKPDQRWARLVQEALDLIQLGLAVRPLPCSVFGGVLGPGWLVEHLQGWLVATDPSLNESLDGALAGALDRGARSLPMEWCGGWAGAGLYALTRYGATGNKVLLEGVLEILWATRRPWNSGVTWPRGPEALPEPMRKDYPGGHVNLGVAHGVPGIVGFLGLAAGAGALAPRYLGLLDEAVAALLEAQEPPEAPFRFRRYGAWNGPGHCEPTRVAWCYGDLGVSMALLRAAQGRGREDWFKAALAVGRDVLGRGLPVVGPLDACLCHGTVGNAHLLHRWYQASGDPAFLEGAQRWFEASWSVATLGEAGEFRYFRPNRSGAPGQPEPELSLLQGLLGTGLGLLAAVAGTDPTWDRLLLAS